MSSLTDQLETRVKAAKDRFALAKLKDEITALLASAEFRRLSQDDKNRIEDLLVEVLSKQEQYKGCDPLSTILEH